MRITIPLRSAAEIERLHTAAYSFAETRAGGSRPSVAADTTGAFMVAHIAFDDDQAARDFRLFWFGFRDRRLDRAA